MTPTAGQGNWEHYQVHVLAELKRLNEEITKLEAGLQKIDKDVLSLKIRATVWGAIAGSCVTLLPVAIRMILSSGMAK